jgi:hypothetical protein
MSWNVGIIKKRLNPDSTILLQDQMLTHLTKILSMQQLLIGQYFEVNLSNKISSSLKLGLKAELSSLIIAYWLASKFLLYRMGLYGIYFIVWIAEY